MAENDDKNPEDHDKRKAAKHNLGKLVFGTMVTGGALGLAGLTAQAHGNASSHAELALRWNFDDYVVQRELRMHPGAESTALQDRYQRLSKIEKLLGGAKTGTGMVGGIRADALDTKMLGAKALGADGGVDGGGAPANWRENASSFDDLQRERFSLGLSLARAKEGLALTPASRDALAALEAGNKMSAGAALEGDTPSKTLANYIVLQTDLYNLGAVGGLSTPAYLKEITAVSKDALSLQEKQAPGDLAARGAILTNWASAAAPDIGRVSDADTSAGRAAAEQALKAYRELGNPDFIGRALYMVGVYDYRAGDYAAAQAHFADSLKTLDGSKDGNSIAWSKLYLGLSQRAQQPKSKSAAANIEAARAYFASVSDQYGLDYIQFITRPN